MMCCPPTRPYLVDSNPHNLPIQELRKGLEMVTTEILHDGLGNTLYRVSRVFPNAASASHAVEILGQVNPAAFAPLPPEPWELELARPLAENIDSCVGVEFIPGTAPSTEQLLDALQLSDDDYKNPAEPPRCATGVCGLD